MKLMMSALGLIGPALFHCFWRQVVFAQELVIVAGTSEQLSILAKALCLGSTTLAMHYLKIWGLL